jgi:hypothetical protein
MSLATAGPGFLLARLGTTIAEVKDIKGPALKTDIVDVTNQSSPDGYEEKIPTLKRSGAVTFQCHFIPTDGTHDGSTGLLKAYADRSLDEYTLDLQGGNLWTFNAYVVGFDETAPVAGVLTADVTLEVSGPPVLT